MKFKSSKEPSKGSFWSSRSKKRKLLKLWLQVKKV